MPERENHDLPTRFAFPTEVLEQLSEDSFEGLPEMIRVLVNEAMRMERQNHLRARHYKRTERRRGVVNGYKPEKLKTRVGEIDFEVTQVRDGGFYPQALEKGMRSERALMLGMTEMYVQGDSTRKAASLRHQQ